jgi:type 1 fimbriae regulatory protein FimB
MGQLRRNAWSVRIFNERIRARREAGPRFRVHPHMLRHACGFSLAEQGIDTRLIQDYLEHKDTKNTVIYTETSRSDCSQK